MMRSRTLKCCKYDFAFASVQWQSTLACIGGIHVIGKPKNEMDFLITVASECKITVLGLILRYCVNHNLLMSF